MRDRKHQIDLYLTPEQHAKLRSLAKATGDTQSGVLRAMLDGWELVAQPSADITELLKQLTKIGTNLNQIAWKANSLRLLDADEYWQVASQLTDLLSDIRALVLPRKVGGNHGGN